MLAQKYIKASPKHTQRVKKNKQKMCLSWTHTKKTRRNSLTHFCTLSGNYQNPKGRAVHIILLKSLCLFHTNVEQVGVFMILTKATKSKLYKLSMNLPIYAVLYNCDLWVSCSCFLSIFQISAPYPTPSFPKLHYLYIKYNLGNGKDVIF